MDGGRGVGGCIRVGESEGVLGVGERDMGRESQSAQASRVLPPVSCTWSCLARSGTSYSRSLSLHPPRLTTGRIARIRLPKKQLVIARQRSFGRLKIVASCKVFH